MPKTPIQQILEHKLPLAAEIRPLIYALATISFITIIGVFLALQGWRSRKPAFDMLTYIYSTDALLHHGTLPKYGDISSYGSFSPPGTAWLMIPGMLLFHDPRLFEKAGSTLLHFGTLLGIFLLARRTLGSRSAYLSTVLYGLSGIGLSFAGSLWPIGHPFFYVWTAYFACLWATRQDAKYLVAAIVVWATGMYVDMAITPAITILPVLWLVYRPRVFSWYLLPAGVFILALWYPYLHFEATRDYADIKSQLMRQNIAPANFKDAWCNPNFVMRTREDSLNQVRVPVSAVSSSQNDAPSLLARLWVRVMAIKDGLLSNFMENTNQFGFSVLLLLICIFGLGLTGLQSNFVNLMRGAEYLPRPIVGLVERLRLSEKNGARHPERVRAFVIGLLMPWFLLLLVAEPGRSERFLWLWPLQAILLAAAVTNFLPQLHLSSKIIWIAQLALIAVIASTAVFFPLKSWYQTGWAGEDAEEVRVVANVAHHIQSRKKEQVAIGYQLFFYPFMVKDHILDPHYKIGAEFDGLFRYMYGISNINQCAEGISPSDEYRIVQIRPEQSEGAPKNYFEVSQDNFPLLQQFDNYEVLIRN